MPTPPKASKPAVPKFVGRKIDQVTVHQVSVQYTVMLPNGKSVTLIDKASADRLCDYLNTAKR